MPTTRTVTRTVELEVVDDHGAPEEEVTNPVSAAVSEGAGVIAAENLDQTKGSCCPCFSSSQRGGGWVVFPIASPFVPVRSGVLVPELRPARENARLEIQSQRGRNSHQINFLGIYDL